MAIVRFGWINQIRNILGVPSVISRWTHASVSKKLYAVVGLMALLIASELFTLIFVMHILSAVRSFVGGEGLWSKAQKDAVASLQRYATTYDSKYYEAYLAHLSIPLGDRRARFELLKPEPNMEEIRKGFEQGEIHPNDIDGLVDLIRRFYWVSYVKRALVVWTEADALVDELMVSAVNLKTSVDEPPYARDTEVIHQQIKKIELLDVRLTALEKEFSATLGEGSRWLEGVLKILLMFAVLTVEATGLFLTFTFSRNLTRSLKELSTAAFEVGKGNFSQSVPVRSQDELGQLAEALNQMIADLKQSIGEKKKAESANKIKSLFLANMSHEIRTPLGVILGVTEILKGTDITEDDQKKYLEVIERTGNNLKRIINDILDISKVEAGHLEIEKTNFVLPDFMTELDSMLSLRAERNQNQLSFVKIGTTPVKIHTDRLRLRQILVNLIDNALKFTKNGKVIAEYWVSDEKLSFRISDTGIGISGSDVKQLFKPFSQADSSASRKYDGTGLGLILSKRLARAMGGDVILESSRVKEGSVFLATVDYNDSKLKETPAPAPPQRAIADLSVLNGKKVLLVEDSPDNQLIVRVFLKKYQMEVDCAMNGEEGVEKATHGDYDLVLMDVQMPVMDGHEATKVLRGQGFTKPIIALTAHAMKEDRDRCLSIGFNDYLTKPIEAPVLYQTLTKYTSTANIQTPI